MINFKMGGKVLTMLVLVFFILVCLLKCGCYALDLSQCRNDLGMQSREIPDSAITASSSFDKQTVGPQSARIRTEINGGAWCPRSLIDPYTYEYLQIDLEQLTVITMVEIQGRFGSGQGQEFTTEFMLDYQRVDDGNWIRFRNKQGRERFLGNSNTYLAELRKVSPPIIGKRIRFIPYSRKAATVCMRVEMYGCRWEDGAVSYSVKQGNTYSGDVDLPDFTYDGAVSANYLTGGLGQLMDGETGSSNFMMDSESISVKGFEWVGWMRGDLGESDHVELIFRFDSVREFTRIIIHCNNYFSKDARVFRVAVVSFSIGGKYYQSNDVEYHYVRDSFIEYARPVTFSLDRRVGKYVKIRLYFDANWILISEIQFHSVVAEGNFEEEVSRPQTFSAVLPTIVRSKTLVKFGRRTLHLAKPIRKQLMTLLVDHLAVRHTWQKADTWDQCQCHWEVWSSWSNDKSFCFGVQERSRSVTLTLQDGCGAFEDCADSGYEYTRSIGICKNGGTPSPLWYRKCDCSPGTYGSCCDHVVNCGHPGIIENGERLGSDFSYGQTVRYTCHANYFLTGGDETRTCQDDFEWSGTQPTCALITSCPSDPCLNGGVCTDLSTCTCSPGWSGRKCEKDVQPPMVISCPSDIYMETTDENTRVTWTTPIFTDPMSHDVEVTSDYLNPESVFPWGDFTVEYVATKPSNGLQVSCSFTVRVRPKPCPDLPVPANGSLVCSDWGTDYGRYCLVFCQKNHASLSYRRWFICSPSGMWLTTGPSHPKCDVELDTPEDGSSYHPDYSTFTFTSCLDNMQVGRIRNSFIEEIRKSPFARFCSNFEAECSSENVRTQCSD